jgi:cobalt-zinc-cadmium efflux system membrane fusion protein
MNRKHRIYISAIAGAGMLAAVLILRGGGPAKGEIEHDDHQGAATAPQAGKIVLSDAQIQANGIGIALSAPRRIASAVRLSGEIRVNGERSVEVPARAGGMIETVRVSAGQQVKQGDALAVLSSAQVADLRNDLRTAAQRLALANTTLAREKTLWEQQVSAEQDYLAARQALQEATSGVQNAREKLAGVGAEAASPSGLARYTLRAPIAGTITAMQAAAGEAALPDKPLFSIADLSTVWLDLAVPAQELAHVRPGSPAEVHLDGVDAAATAKVAWVSALATSPSRSATARIVLPNPHGQWRPGLFASAAIQVQQKEVAVGVSRDAVHALDGKSVVFVRVPGGFVAQPVVTGLADGQYVEIVSGLRAGAPHAAGGSNLVKAEHEKADADDAH